MKAFKLYTVITGFLFVSFNEIEFMLKNLLRIFAILVNPGYRWFIMFSFIY